MKSENRNLKIYENLKLLIHIGHYLILLIKKNSNRNKKYFALSDISICYTWKKTLKSYIKSINLKCKLQNGTINLNYLIDQILYQTFEFILSILSKNIKS